MALTRELRHHLGSVLRPGAGRPDYASGIRAAVATAVPLAVGLSLHLPGVSWTALAAFLAVLADKGGPYRERALAMAASTAVVTLSGSVAALLGGYPALAVAGMLLWGTGAGLLRVYGTLGPSLSAGAAVAFAASLDLPATPSGALARALMLAAGGVWAMGFSLAFWPLLHERPVLAAIARCYRALADLAESGALAATRGALPADPAPPHPGASRVRQAIEAARRAVAASQPMRDGGRARAERSLVLVETADQIFTWLSALAETLDALPAAARTSPELGALQARLAALPAELRGVAEAVLEERRPAIPAGGPATGAGIRTHALRAGAGPLAHVDRMLGAIGEFLAVAEDAARGAGVAPGESPDRSSHPPTPRLLERAWGPWRQLRWDSVLLRHALRVGIATAAGVLVSHLLGLSHGHWVTVAIVVILQPYVAATFQRGLQRILGTLAGGAIAALVAARLHDPRALLLVIFVLAAVAVTIRSMNYTLYAIFLTPTFILLAELGQIDPRLPEVRLVNTLIGGVLAFAAARLLWPDREREEVPGAAAEALGALAAYLRAGAPGSLAGPGRTAAVEARRRAGIALLGAEGAVQRALGESPADELAEPLLALAAYARRLATSVTAIASYQKDAGAAATAFQEVSARVLDDLAGALREQRSPRPLPREVTELAEGDARLLDPVLAATLRRAAARLIVLYSAAARVSGDPAQAAVP